MGPGYITCYISISQSLYTKDYHLCGLYEKLKCSRTLMTGHPPGKHVDGCKILILSGHSCHHSKSSAQWDLQTEISKFPKLLDGVTQLSGRSNYQTQFATWYLQNYLMFVTLLSGRSNYPMRCATSNLQISKFTWFLSPSWVGDPITRHNLPPDISKLPKLPDVSPCWVGDLITQCDVPPQISKFPNLPDFCHMVEWVIQLPDLICHLISPYRKITRSLLPGLSRRCNYQNWFAIWNLHIAKLPNFCHPVEWVIQLPEPICHLICPNCKITWSLLPGLSRQSNYQNWFATRNLQITQFLSLCWVGDAITRVNLPPEISKLPIFVIWLSGQSNYPTSFATWILQIAKITQFCKPGNKDQVMLQFGDFR